VAGDDQVVEHHQLPAVRLTADDIADLQRVAAWRWVEDQVADATTSG
jgi:hypothetical protein